MSFLSEVANLIRFINQHPLGAKEKRSVYSRFFRWQIASRLLGMPVIAPFVGPTKLIINKGMTGATGNIYVGLQEFCEMGLVLHFLREGDLFGDIGANVGAYTVLASGVCRSRTVAIEPLPETFAHLTNNIKINNLDHLVTARSMGLSSDRGVLKFTNNLDTMNHVVSQNEGVDGTEIQVDTVDNLFFGEAPILLKLDVEGFEAPVLAGARQTLRNPTLKVLIVELNGSGRRYGFEDAQIHKDLSDYGFAPFQYSPLDRELLSHRMFDSQNTVYIRDVDFVVDRLKSAPPFSVIGRWI